MSDRRPSCVGADPQLFEDNRPLDDLIRTARQYCAPCPFRGQCLELAGQEHNYGLWGGWLFGRYTPRNLLAARLPREHVEVGCGTRTAAERHLRNGETLDPACADARRNYYRERDRLRNQRRRRRLSVAS